MAKRIEVILQDADYLEIQRAARVRRMSIAEWIRQALATARRQEPSGTVAEKLVAVRAAAKYSFPTADIDTMLADVEAGYSGKRP